MDAIREEHERLVELVDAYSEKTSNLISFNEAEFLSSYRSNICDIQEELEALRRDVIRAQAQLHASEEIAKAEQSLAWFHRESLRLDELCLNLERDDTFLSKQKKALEEQTAYLNQQSRLGLKGNYILDQEQKMNKKINEEEEKEQQEGGASRVLTNHTITPLKRSDKRMGESMRHVMDNLDQSIQKEEDKIHQLQFEKQHIQRLLFPTQDATSESEESFYGIVRDIGSDINMGILRRRAISRHLQSKSRKVISRMKQELSSTAGQDSVLLPPIIPQHPTKKGDHFKSSFALEHESLGGNYTTYDRISLLKKLVKHSKVHKAFLDFLVERVMKTVRDKERMERMEEEEREEEERLREEKVRQASFQTLSFRNASFTFGGEGNATK